MSGRLKYTVKHVDGRVYTGKLGVDIRKTLDKRSDRSEAQLVFECRDPSGVWVRVWQDEMMPGFPVAEMV